MPGGRPKGSKNKSASAGITPQPMPQIKGPTLQQNQVSQTGRKGGSATTVAGRKTKYLGKGPGRAIGSSAGTAQRQGGNLPGWDSQQWAAMVQQNLTCQTEIKELKADLRTVKQQLGKINTFLSRGAAFGATKTGANT